MMNFLNKQLYASILIVLLCFGCKPNTSTKSITAEDYKKAAKHMDRGLNKLVYNKVSSISWNEDKAIYSTTTKDGKQFFLVDATTNKKTLAFNHDTFAKELSKILNDSLKANDLPIYSLAFSASDNTLSFKAHGLRYSCFFGDYTITEKKTIAFPAKRNEHVSPNGKLAAYIQNYNLWIRDLETNQKTQITFDGEKDFGYATNNAGWIKSDNAVLKWSPNSDKIATFQQDARGVGEMYLTSTNVGHPKLESWKHPLPGDLNVFKLERVIIHLGNTPKVVRLNMKPDFQRGTTTDHVADWDGVLLDAQWKNDGSEFAFISSSRDHKEAHLQIANTQTGQVRSVYKETVDTYYESGVDHENWKVLFDTNEFIWFSEQTDWGHVYLHDLTTGKLKHQITKGDWAVQQLYHVDETNRELIFTAGGKEEGNPYHKYLYTIKFDGSDLKNISPDKGAHSFNFSDGFDYFVDTYSTTTNPPVSVLRNRSGEKLLELETADISELKTNNWQQPIEFTVKARDNKTDLYGLMYLPSHYDETKKYPVLNNIYPGPQAGTIGYYAFTATRRDFQAVAELGFIVVGVDAMGTPGRSKSFHDAYYGNMGDNGLPDNITAIKQLAKKYKGMDTTRVGIWGHSGGGFASTRALFAYPDFYDVAVSGAGNHDNRNYEADWGEKWQGLLSTNTTDGKQNKTTNYDNQANQLLANELKGKLLITHGSMDDNVNPSSTMLVVEALIKANKDFDMIIFPNQRHGYGKMTKYMTRKRWDYWVKHLLNVEPPKEFPLEDL